MSNQILVLGGSGKTGKHVADTTGIWNN